MKSATRSAVWRAISLGVGIPLFSVASVIFTWIGLLPFGNSYDGVGECVVWGGFRGVPTEEVRATTSYWPLGIVCQHGDAVIAHQNWIATILGYGCAIAAIIGLVLLGLNLATWQRGRVARAA